MILVLLGVSTLLDFDLMCLHPAGLKCLDLAYYY